MTPGICKLTQTGRRYSLRKSEATLLIIDHTFSAFHHHHQQCKSSRKAAFKVNLLGCNNIRSFDNRFEVNWPPEPTLVLHWISKFFLFGALPSDTLKIKHTKNLKEIPSRHVLENLLEKSKHSCLYTSETHWQFTGILPIYNARHAKSHNSRL